MQTERRVAANPQTKPTDLGCTSAGIGCYHPHLPSPFIVATQPKSRYSFYHRTECGRLSRPKHYSKGVQPVPEAVCRGCYCDSLHNWPRHLTPQPYTLPLDHCDLQRQTGVNYLPRIVTWQRGGRESNWQPSVASSTP